MLPVLVLKLKVVRCEYKGVQYLDQFIKLKDGRNKREEEWFKTGILLQNKLSLILKLGLEDSIVVELWGHRVFQKFVLDRFSCFLCLSVCLPG